jgi:hypothetical protein
MVRGQRKRAVAIALLVVVPTASPNFGCKGRPGAEWPFRSLRTRGRAGAARATLPQSAQLRGLTMECPENVRFQFLSLRQKTRLRPVASKSLRLRDVGYVIDSSSLRAVRRVLNAMKLHPGDGFRKKNA